MRVCSIGVWDDTIPGIEFDEDGVSNFYKLQEAMIKQNPRGEKGKIIWDNIVDQIKGQGKGIRYDCVVGLSGGVDSSYLLMQLIDNGLRPLAVNLDNGFNSKIAVENIYKLTKKLNVDLETYVVNYEEIKTLLKAYMRAGLPWIDTPTDKAIKAVMYKVASEEKIKFIIRGNDFRSEGKQPKEWTYSDNKQLRFIYKKFGDDVKLKTYPKLPLYKYAYYGFVKQIKDIRPLYYLDYDKQKARKILKDNFGWEDYGGHHHENLFTKFAIAYWLPRKFNIDKRKISLSAQIVNGMLSRQEAIEILKKPAGNDSEFAELRDYIIKKLGLTKHEFEEIWNSPGKQIFEYPSNYNLIYWFAERFSPIIKKLFAFTPMSITEKEIINN